MRLDGQSYVEVAERLLKYRVANGLPLGKPLDEIHAYVCTKWPHFCNSNPRIEAPTSSEPTFAVKVMQWLQILWRQQALIPTQHVSEAEANRRASVCAGCPRQQSWADYGCGSCVDSIRRQSLVFRAGKETYAKPTGCSILGQENQAACWGALSVLPDSTPEQRQLLPTRCWRK